MRSPNCWRRTLLPLNTGLSFCLSYAFIFNLGLSPLNPGLPFCLPYAFIFNLGLSPLNSGLPFCPPYAFIFDLGLSKLRSPLAAPGDHWALQPRTHRPSTKDISMLFDLSHLYSVCSVCSCVCTFSSTHSTGFPC